MGEWTSRLHKLIKEEYERQAESGNNEESTMARIQHSIKRKYQGAKNLIAQVSVISEKKVDKEDRFNFVENFIENEQELSHGNTSSKGVQGENLKVKRSKTFAESVQQRSSRRPIGLVRYISIQEPKTVEYNTQQSLNVRGRVDVEEAITHKSNRVENVQPTRLEKPLDIYIDGPFGSPSSNIYRAEHAVLIGTGIGVTPFASILQSIAHRYSHLPWTILHLCSMSNVNSLANRYLDIKHTCPSCSHSWIDSMEGSMFNLKKVDFIWINRDQKSFEWFVNLLSQLEAEQQEHGGQELGRFLEMHMFFYPFLTHFFTWQVS